MGLDDYLEKSKPNVVTQYKEEQCVDDYIIRKDIYTICFKRHKIRFPSGLLLVYDYSLSRMEYILENYEKSLNKDEVYESIYLPIIGLINELDNTRIDKQFADFCKNEEENEEEIEIEYNYSSKYQKKTIKKKITDFF